MSDLGFVEGMLVGMPRVEEARRRGEKGRVFDWHRAAELIRERNPTRVEAGLSDDWAYTGGIIYEKGKPTPAAETYTYLFSMWAIPQIDIDGERIDCFLEGGSNDWDSGTYWPQSALDILNKE